MSSCPQRMRIAKWRYRIWLPWSLIVWCMPMVSFSQQDRDEFMEREKAKFLCEWRLSHLPTDNPHPLDVCQNPDLPIDTIRVQLREYWDFWFKKPHEDFEAAWSDGTAQPAAQAAWVRRQHARQVEMEQANVVRDRENDREFAAKAGRMKNADLCLAYHFEDRQEARAELERRKALTAFEWRLVDKHSVAIGMSEAALFCSLGSAEINTTVNKYGEDKQYIYSPDFYVYVENGVVTAVQDHTR
jgi:hypothetical protein